MPASVRVGVEENAGMLFVADGPLAVAVAGIGPRQEATPNDMAAKTIDIPMFL